MIELELGVEDLANTRFAISPLAEAVHSLWAVSDPTHHALHLPWVRAARRRLDGSDMRILLALVGPTRYPHDFRGAPSRALPDFLTPRPARFISRFEDQMALVRETPREIVRRDLAATHAPNPLPDVLGPGTRGDGAASALRGDICSALERHWEQSLAPIWPHMQRVLEGDTTYRARQLAVGGARLLFADIHPNVRWADGVLSIDEMVGQHKVAAAGRGLLLVPSIFAYKPVAPLDPGEPPHLAYPSRGVGTLWSPAPEPDASALIDLLGRPRVRLLHMLDEPLPTIEIARRLNITPSAVSQHLRILHNTGLVSRTRDRRHVLYRRTRLGDQMITGLIHPEAAI